VERRQGEARTGSCSVIVHGFRPTWIVRNGKRVQVCAVCSLGAAAAAHQGSAGIAARDVAPETDGAQAWRFIRGEKP